MDMPFPSTSTDRYLLRELILGCHTETPDRFTQIIYPKLRALVPHEMFMYGGTNTRAHIYRYINVSFPQDYIDQASMPTGGLNCPMVGKWLGSRQPLYCNYRIMPRPSLVRTKQKQYEALCDLGIGDIALHGAMDNEVSAAGCYAFARMAEPWNSRFTTILNLVIPHIHAALSTHAEMGKDNEPVARLSPRELDVLYWLIEGKTDAAIGALLGISAYTVRIHIQNVIRKLGAANRTHAVAKAFRSRIVKL